MTQTITELGLKAQTAIHDDPRTHKYHIEVLEENGVVTLKGSVPSFEISRTAESVVKDVFG